LLDAVRIYATVSPQRPQPRLGLAKQLDDADRVHPPLFCLVEPLAKCKVRGHPGGLHERQPPVSQDKIRAVTVPPQRFDVVREIVAGKKCEQHEVRLVFRPALAQGQILLRCAIAVYRKADHLYPPTVEGRTLRQYRFEPLPIQVLQRDLDAFAHRIAEQEDAVHPRRLRERMVDVAVAFLVD